jgi:histidinol-phosphate aminotransferase
MTRDRLSRRDLLGGLVSAAAVGVALPARPAARSTLDDVVRRSGSLIRLGSNENSAGLGPAARAAFTAAADEANRYPGRVWQTLMEALTARHQISSSSIYLTPGSGELLRAATLAFTSPSRALVTAAPTFEAPARTAGSTGAEVRAVAVAGDGRLDLDAMLAKAAGAGLVYICNPNNPTGGSVPGAALTEFIARLKTAAPEARILVDEAYFEYAEEPGYATMIPLAVADPRVIVTRTFSKVFGMAGLRVGYAVGQPSTIGDLDAHGSDGTLSSASLAAAAAAFTDAAHIEAERARNRAVRQFTREKFEGAGYRVLPSAANFVMIDIKRDAGSFGWQCRQQRIAVARPFPPLATCLRLTIGTQAEMDEAVPAILQLLEAPASARVVAPAVLDERHAFDC